MNTIKVKVVNSGTRKGAVLVAQTVDIAVTPFYQKLSFWLPVLGIVGSFIAGLQGIFPNLAWTTTVLMVIQALVAAIETNIPKSSIVK